MAPASRLLRLLALFQSQDEWSGAVLAELLHVSPRTLRRDVDRLGDSFGWSFEVLRGDALRTELQQLGRQLSAQGGTALQGWSTSPGTAPPGSSCCCWPS